MECSHTVKRSRRRSKQNKLFKMFVGGLLPITNTNTLRKEFIKYGTINSCYILFDKNGVSKGYGFVVFATKEARATALADMHIIDGKEVDCSLPAERAVYNRDGALIKKPSEESEYKVFIVMLPRELSRSEIADNFSIYGEVEQVLTFFRGGDNSLGFGFVKYFSKESARKASEANCVRIGHHSVQVKRALSKDEAMLAKANYSLDKEYTSYNSKLHRLKNYVILEPFSVISSASAPRKMGKKSPKAPRASLNSNSPYLHKVQIIVQEGKELEALKFYSGFSSTTKNIRINRHSGIGVHHL